MQNPGGAVGKGGDGEKLSVPSTRLAKTAASGLAPLRVLPGDELDGVPPPTSSPYRPLLPLLPGNQPPSSQSCLQATGHAP